MQFEKKTVVLKEEVQVVKVKKTEERYTCPKCNFENKDHGLVTDHYMKQHAFTKSFKLGDHDVMYFEDEASAEFFVDRQPYREMSGHCGEVVWTGPGWYHWVNNEYEEQWPQLVEIHDLLNGRIEHAKNMIKWSEDELLLVDQEIAKLT